ncbi:MAG: MFS transporter [Candidatus Heimdallarchaeota archaeon]|nr:MFS transporter [Candidatus Heimdallarchaeota archaeon]
MGEKTENYISLWFVTFVALGFATTQISWSFFNLVVPIILQDEAGFNIPLGFVGFIMTWDNIIALFIQPAVGSYSDKVRTRIGRRLPFIIPGVIFGAILFYLLSISRTYAIVFFLTNIVAFNIVMALYRSPAASLMPDLIVSKNRSFANSIMNIVGGVAVGGALFVGGKFLDDDDVEGAFALIAISMIVFLIILLSFIREPKRKKEVRVQEGSKSVIREIIFEIKQLFRSDEKSLLYILLAITFWFTAVFAIEAWLSTYIGTIFLPEEDGLVAAGEAGQVLFIFPIAFVLFAIIGGILGTYLGRIQTTKFGAILMIIGTIIAIAIQPNDVFGIEVDWRISFPVAFFFAGAGWGLVTANAIVIVWELAKDNGIGTGMYYAFASIAAISGPTIAGIIMDIFGVQWLFRFSLFFFILGSIAILRVIKGETGDRAEIVAAG